MSNLVQQAIILNSAIQKNPAELLLMDVAIRIQLSNTEYRLMAERYKALSDHIDRPASPLHGRITRLYTQGSAAIGATNKAATEKEEYDVDAMAELNLTRDIDPEVPLALLHKSVVGTKDSPTIYVGMTERCTRAVQICYADGMHVDITPTVLFPEREERTGYIFHSKPEDPSEPRKSLIANPYGFAEYFKATTSLDLAFANLYEERTNAYDSANLLQKAETEKLPDQAHVQHKSKALISLQLIKRMRNIAYEKHPKLRMPPSVLLACWVAQSANHPGNITVLDELIYQTSCMVLRIKQAELRMGLVEQHNPRCYGDNFTDRWPKDMVEQRLFLNILNEFIQDMTKLKHGGLDMLEMQNIMEKHFGERPVKKAVAHLFEQQGAARKDGKGLWTPRSNGVVLVGAGLSRPAGAESMRPNNFFGDDW